MAVTTTTSLESLQLDERELRAWRGMLRAHAALTKALDADLEAAHGLPLSSYEVLMYLIRRESCSDDARGAYAVLTPAGAQKLALARSTHLSGVRSLFLQHFSEPELDALGDLWERVMPGAASAPGPSCG